MNRWVVILGVSCCLWASGTSTGGETCMPSHQVEVDWDAGQAGWPGSVALGGGWHAIGDDDYDDGLGIVKLSKLDPASQQWTDYQEITGAILNQGFGTSIELSYYGLAVYSADSNLVELFVLEEGKWAWVKTLTPWDPDGYLTGAISLHGDSLLVCEVDSNGQILVVQWMEVEGEWQIVKVIPTAVSEPIVRMDYDGEWMVLGFPTYDADGSNNNGYLQVWRHLGLEGWSFIGSYQPYPDVEGAAGGSHVAISEGTLSAVAGSHALGGYSIDVYQVFGQSISRVLQVPAEVEQIVGIDMHDSTVAVAVSDQVMSAGATLIQLHGSGADMAWTDAQVSFDGEAPGSPLTAIAMNDNFLIGRGYGAGYVPNVWIAPAYDCNNNGVADQCDLAGTPGWDIDRDGRYDWCACPGNVNPHLDWVIDVNDVYSVLFAWGGNGLWGPGEGDCNGDTLCNIEDLIIVLRNWGQCWN
ncbi:MAG: hypothetical protein MK101_09280 [Phycisphaerales bacterium]|nr:hypothetical protein [Phycisphaerales bacterium]